MGQLENMGMFIRIVEAGGISKAADQLDIAKSAVSRRLSELESHVGAQLINRTTRKSSLTDAGSQYYIRAKNILEEIDKLDEQTRGEKTKLEGTLKLSVPLSFGLLHLSALIDEFARLHPNLSIQLDFSDRHIDLVEEGYEMAIRIGNLADSSLQAKRLTRIRQVVCASPSYIAKHGEPKSLTELTHHQILDYSLRNEPSLQLPDKNGKKIKIDINAKIKANNGDFLKQMAIGGHGITIGPTFIAYQELRTGQLVTILNDHKLPDIHAYAVYPQNRFLSQRCRLLIDFIAEKFGDTPYWDDY